MQNYSFLLVGAEPGGRLLWPLALPCQIAHLAVLSHRDAEPTSCRGTKDLSQEVKGHKQAFLVLELTLSSLAQHLPGTSASLDANGLPHPL